MNKTFIQEYVVSSDSDEQRLDIFLAEMMGSSRSAAQKLAKEGLVEISGEVVAPKQIVTLGEVVSVFKHDPKESPEIPVLFENEDVLVIDKPSGVTVHPAAGEKSRTVVELFDKPLFVVHRLDKGTSGVMILAKNESTAEFLKKQFAYRKVQKEYLALVVGDITDDQGVIELDLTRSENTRGNIVPTAEGRKAVTEFTVRERYSAYTLISAFPKTGRTHQIRTHLAAIGHPVYGDVRYGSDRGKARIFLHAQRLSLKLPNTKKAQTWEASLPKELLSILSRF